MKKYLEKFTAPLKRGGLIEDCLFTLFRDNGLEGYTPTRTEGQIKADAIAYYSELNTYFGNDLGAEMHGSMSAMDESGKYAYLEEALSYFCALADTLNPAKFVERSEQRKKSTWADVAAEDAYQSGLKKRSELLKAALVKGGNKGVHEKVLSKFFEVAQFFGLLVGKVMAAHYLDASKLCGNNVTDIENALRFIGVTVNDTGGQKTSKIRTVVECFCDPSKEDEVKQKAIGLSGAALVHVLEAYKKTRVLNSYPSYNSLVRYWGFPDDSRLANSYNQAKKEK